MKKILLSLCMLFFFAVSAMAAVNINTADQSALESITGIGPAKAQAIIEYRNHEKFETVDDLMKVKGFGKKSMAKIRTEITVEN
ncbi:MAG: helix-hairpin-helix domain-containing protein [Thermodesulfobacteriota bacterium]|nr:helix-hairpin-helix domain-containing protein [Thermodesulfobacteriota bacterium]